MNVLKHSVIDAADFIVGGAILTGVGVGAAFIVGGAPIIAAGAAISAICAGTTIVVSRVASHVFDGLFHNHPKTARCFKAIAFFSSVGVGIGTAAGVALLAPTLGITLGISLTAGVAILGSLALAATVGYVAYLALRGVYNLCKKNEPNNILNHIDVPPLDQEDEDFAAPMFLPVQSYTNFGGTGIYRKKGGKNARNWDQNNLTLLQKGQILCVRHLRQELGNKPISLEANFSSAEDQFVENQPSLLDMVATFENISLVNFEHANQYGMIDENAIESSSVHAPYIWRQSMTPLIQMLLQNREFVRAAIISFDSTALLFLIEADKVALIDPYGESGEDHCGFYRAEFSFKRAGNDGVVTVGDVQRVSQRLGDYLEQKFRCNNFEYTVIPIARQGDFILNH